MSRHRFEIIVDVNDEALAAHDGEEKTPPNDVADWESFDIQDAGRHGLLDGWEITEYLGADTS